MNCSRCVADLLYTTTTTMTTTRQSFFGNLSLCYAFNTMMMTTNVLKMSIWVWRRWWQQQLPPIQQQFQVQLHLVQCHDRVLTANKTMTMTAESSFASVASPFIGNPSMKAWQIPIFSLVEVVVAAGGCHNPSCLFQVWHWLLCTMTGASAEICEDDDICKDERRIVVR